LVLSETDTVALDRPGEKVVMAQSLAFQESIRRGTDWKAKDVQSVLAVSQSVARGIEAHLGVKSTLISPSVDQNLFRPACKERVIVYMSRKNPMGVQRILAQARTLRFEQRPIDGLSRTQVARELGRASIALVACPSEGFGLFALEAMASGCLVVGFAGGGGLDFMRNGENCLLAPDGDEGRAAEQLALAMHLIENNEQGMLVHSALATAHRFSPERERGAVLHFWSSFLCRKEQIA
jgi:hypothetical protein